MVSVVRKRRGRGWGLGRRAVLAAPQGAFQGLDRVGPLGGQVLGGSAADPLKRQGMLEFSNPVSSRLAAPSATRGLVLLFPVGSVGLAWPQAGGQKVLGRDAPEPTLTGNGLGRWRAPEKRP